MAYENKPNSGAMFKNENKKGDKHPDYTGTWYNENGEKMSIAMWLNTSKAGKPYFSLAAQEWVDRTEEAPTPATAQTTATDEDLPF